MRRRRSAQTKEAYRICSVGSNSDRLRYSAAFMISKILVMVGRQVKGNFTWNH